MIHLPRLMFAAPASGGGKTTVTCAFLRLLIQRGETPCAFKCGPDYIDPMFHRTALGVDSWNLDLFFSNPDQVRMQMARHGQGHSLAVLEGVMGLYDGMAQTDQASSWHLARETQTPVVLVLRPKGSSLTLAAQVQGLLNFRRPSQLQGILLNSCSPAQYDFYAPMLQRETGLPVLGYLPEMEGCSFSTRHLGLTLPEEESGLFDNLNRLTEQMSQSVDVEGLLALARTPPPLPEPPPVKSLPVSVRVGVARDEALCFYYNENLELLERLGGELVFFSPIHDGCAPEVDGLYLGGGYPELHAQALSENNSMRNSIRRAWAEGMPILAECGGFLYLQRALEDGTGRLWPMAGVLEGEGHRTGGHGRFGYITLTPRGENPFLKAGETIAAHEFHRWDVSDSGTACTAQKPCSQRSWPCVVTRGDLFAGFPHLYFPSNPDFPRRFLAACGEYRRRKERV